MFAANALGAIVVPVNFRLAPDEVAYILTDSGASLLVADETTGAAGAAARAACQHQIGFVSTGGRPTAPTRTSRCRQDPPGHWTWTWTCQRTAPP
jgi:fatty-acyl-CoA synthase